MTPERDEAAIRMRVAAAYPGELAVAWGPNPGETKAQYVTASMKDNDTPLWVVIEAGAWKESDDPYDLYAVMGDGPFGKAHAELFAHAYDDITYLLSTLDAERERNAKLERVLDAAWDIYKGRCTTFGYHFKGGDGEALDCAISEARRP